MKKLRKYIYPPIFSVGFLVFWYTLGKIINATDDGGYGGLGLALVTLFAWIIIAIPIHCIIYSKHIIDSKLKFLFPVYNALLIVVSHFFPFNGLQDYITVVIAFFVWVIFWNVLPLAMRIIARKNKDNILKKDDAHLTNLLLQNKNKNIIVIIITCLYIPATIRQLFYYSTDKLSYILSLISATVFLALIFSKTKEFYFKKWMLSFVLFAELVGALLSICSRLSNIEFQLKNNPVSFPISLTLSCLTIIATAAMFITSLFNFKYIKLFKYSALGFIILAVVKFIFSAINLICYAYDLIDVNGKLYINTTAIMLLVINAAYYIGIYILTTNKPNPDTQSIS